MFIHFGINTFTDREWGSDGTEDPVDVRANSLRRPAMGAIGLDVLVFRAMILTAKHHDGFCLWPSQTTSHTVAASSWRGGQGDVVREFVDACRAEGIRPGLYLSPWDRNNSTYGDSPRYNDLYCEQLTELLTRYGPLAEMWFDGANGEGPSGKRQTYDWPRFFGLVRRFQPDAVVFSDAGPDVRWCGNERGTAGDPNWSTVDPAIVPYPGASGPNIDDALLHGAPMGTVWRPAEADVSIRPGWFFHPSDDVHVRTIDGLTDLYFSSVGRNSKLLLNVPPTRDGLLHATDVARLTGFRERLDAIFAEDLAANTRLIWRRINAHAAEGELDLGRTVTADTVRLAEDITFGQTVVQYSLYGSTGGDWFPMTRGTTVGYARLERLNPTPFSRVRLVIESLADASPPIGIQLFSGR